MIDPLILAHSAHIAATVLASGTVAFMAADGWLGTLLASGAINGWNRWPVRGICWQPIEAGAAFVPIHGAEVMTDVTIDPGRAGPRQSDYSRKA